MSLTMTTYDRRMSRKLDIADHIRLTLRSSASKNLVITSHITLNAISNAEPVV